jgi:hypothetical protein
MAYFFHLSTYLHFRGNGHMKYSSGFHYTGCLKNGFTMVAQMLSVASVTKTFLLRGLQNIHRSSVNVFVNLFLKYPALSLKVTLNGNYPR